MWTFITAVFVLCVGAVAYLIYTAPEGYEDERGFHYGKPNDEH